MLDSSKPLRIADIGCDTGASSILLAKQLNATVTALAFLQEIIEVVTETSKQERRGDKIHPHVFSMDVLLFKDAEHDMIWSEDAIYNMGFARGVGSGGVFSNPAAHWLCWK